MLLQSGRNREEQTMTRQHFQALADALASVRPDEIHNDEYHQWFVTVDAVANACSRFNNLFDRPKFYHAAGIR